MKVTLATRLNEVVGGRTANALEKAFGLRTVGELLRHYPRRMAERGELTDLAELQVDEDVTVLARVRKVELLGYGRSVRVVITVGDGRDELDLVFFGARQKWRADKTAIGALGMFSGPSTPPTGVPAPVYFSVEPLEDSGGVPGLYV